jgi:hypothetical protein
MRPYVKKPFTKIGLVEWLKVKALSSSSSIIKREREKKGRERGRGRERRRKERREGGREEGRKEIE